MSNFLGSVQRGGSGRRLGRAEKIPAFAGMTTGMFRGQGGWSEGEASPFKMVQKKTSQREVQERRTGIEPATISLEG